MMKTLSAAALSLTLGLTSLGATATPAQANDDLAKFLFGALAIGIIAHGINEANANSTAHQPQVAHPQPQRPHRPVITPNRAVHIPASCERQVQIENRVRNAYGAPCLRRNNVPLDRIASCAREGTINGRPLTYYTKACLRRAGHRV